MKKFLNALFIFMACCAVLLYPLDTDAKVTAVDGEYSYVVPSEYAFTPKFINGVTQFVKSPSYNGMQSTVLRTQGYQNYWVMYKNVGMWRHHIVDMKITLYDVIDTNTSIKCEAAGGYADYKDEDIITFYFRPEELALTIDTKCRDAGTTGIFKIEYFDNQTGESLSDLKSVLTYDDIDGSEQIAYDNQNTKDQFYYAQYGEEHLELVNANFMNPNTSDSYTLFLGKWIWTCTSGTTSGDVECFNTNKVVTNCYNNDCEGCRKSGMMTVLNEGTFTLGWSGYYTGFSAAGFLRIDDPTPMKFVDKEVVKSAEELNYTIEQYVPNQGSKHYYKSWKITDKLESILETSVDNITITSDGDEDVTNMFDISLENNVLTVSAKDDYLALDKLYNRTFIIHIKTKVSSDTKNLKEIKNQAVLNIEYSTGAYSKDILSNEVKTTIEEEPKAIEEIFEIPNTDKFIGKLIYILGIILILSGVVIMIKMKKKREGFYQ